MLLEAKTHHRFVKFQGFRREHRAQMIDGASHVQTISKTLPRKALQYVSPNAPMG